MRLTFVPNPGEEVLAGVVASLFRGLEAVGEWMKITDRRVIFEPRAVNIERGRGNSPERGCGGGKTEYLRDCAQRIVGVD